MIELSQGAAEAVRAYVAAWGLPTSTERLHQRVSSTMDQITQFYEALLPWMEEILAYLNQFTLDAMPEEARSVSYVALSMCEVDNPIRWNEVELSSGFRIIDMHEKQSPYH